MATLKLSLRGKALSMVSSLLVKKAAKSNPPSNCRRHLLCLPGQPVRQFTALVLIAPLVLSTMPTTAQSQGTAQPALSGSIAGQGIQSPGILFVDLKLANSGTAEARNISLKQIQFRTLSGSGSVTYNTTLSPALPLAIAKLAVAATTTIRLFLNVPATVTRFSMTESG